MLRLSTWFLLPFTLGLIGSASAQTILNETLKITPEPGYCQRDENLQCSLRRPCLHREFGVSVAIDGRDLLAAVTSGYPEFELDVLYNVMAYTGDATGQWQPDHYLFGPRNYCGSGITGVASRLHVAIDASHALVGNPFYSDVPLGYVTAFDDAGPDGWTRVPGPFDFSELFILPGADIAIVQETAVVVTGFFDGDFVSVLRHVDDEWVEIQQLDSDALAVDFDGETIVTARGKTSPTSRPETVVVWRLEDGRWEVGQAIDPAAGDAGTEFGGDVAVAGRILLIGAPGDDDRGADAGVVHLFRLGDDGNWGKAAELRPSDASAGSEFGTRVVLDRTVAVITAPGAGVAYWFTIDADGDWIERGKLVPSDGYVGDRFGHSVDVDRGRAVIGAPGRTDGLYGYGISPGAAYLFDVADPDAPLEVAIDVRPGTDINYFNPRLGMIPVAILSTSTAAGDALDFDALQVDPATATFGPDRAGVAVSSRNVQMKDLDRDGDVDLYLRFRARDTGLGCDSTVAELQAWTYAGDPVFGEDTVRPVLCQ